MNISKKVLSIIMAAALSASLCACSGASTGNSSPTNGIAGSDGSVSSGSSSQLDSSSQNDNYYRASEAEFKSYVTALFDTSGYTYKKASDTQYEYLNDSIVKCDKLNYEFTFSGGSLTLPCTYDDLINSGLKAYTEHYEKTNMPDGCYSLYTFLDSNSLQIVASIYNSSGEEALITDSKCEVRDIKIERESNGNGEKIAKFTLGNGITETSTIEDVINAYGLPDNVYYNVTTDYSSPTPDCMTMAYTNDDYARTEFSFNVTGILVSSQPQLKEIDVNSPKKYTIAD